MPATIEKDTYDEWASGASLANVNQNFFEEIPTELEHPANFVVSQEQLPQIPEVTTIPQTETILPTTVVSDDTTETRQGKKGGNITLEKTSRGWKLSLDPQIPSLSVENFYGPNKDELIFSFAESKLEANKTIYKLKKEKLLGGEEHITPAAPPIPRTQASVNVLSADDVYAISNKLNSDDPAQKAEAFDEWVLKRFKMSPDQFADALNSAPEAKRIVESQRVKAEVEEVNKDFVERNPDYIEFVSTDSDEVNKTNIRLLVGRIAKVYLNKKVTKSTSQSIVDDVIYDLYTKGYWTTENLETAKEELIENGLFERSTTPARNSEPQPQQVATPPVSIPSEPAAPRIAASPGQPVGVSLGLPARNNTPVTVPEPTSLTDLDLQKIPLEQLRAIAAAQLKAMR